MLWKTDLTFYPSPKLAMHAPAREAGLRGRTERKRRGRPHALLVVDVDAG
jgi:hypothetical protein